MKYVEACPSPELSSYLSRFWWLEYEPAAGDIPAETVLPDGCPEMVFNLSDRFKRIRPFGDETQSATVVAGQLTRSIMIRPTGKVRLFGVRFKPAGMVPFGRFAAYELQDQTLDIASLLGREGADLEDGIANSADFAAKISVFESYYLGKIGARSRDNKLAAAAADLISTRGGSISIAGLCEMMGVTERSLERRFRFEIGVAPKMFARIVRFQCVVRKIQAAESRNILDAVHDLGYFDQSHLIREFRSFAGESPTAFFDRTHRMSDLFTGAEQHASL